MQNGSAKDIVKPVDGLLEVSAAIRKKEKIKKTAIYVKRFVLGAIGLGALGILVFQGEICLSK